MGSAHEGPQGVASNIGRYVTPRFQAASTSVGVDGYRRICCYFRCYFRPRTMPGYEKTAISRGFLKWCRRRDSIPTGRWAAQRAAKAGKGGRLGDRGPIWGTPVRGGLLVGNCVLLARCPHLYDSDYFPRQGKIIVVEHISPDRPPTRALMRRSYRTPSIPTPSYPGLHPGLVCRAPLGHPLG